VDVEFGMEMPASVDELEKLMNRLDYLTAGKENPTVSNSDLKDLFTQLAKHYETIGENAFINDEDLA
jgi:hypothetical protein